MSLALAFFIFSVVVSGLALYGNHLRLQYIRKHRLQRRSAHH